MGKINKLLITGTFSILLGFSTYGQDNRGPGPLFNKLQDAGILPPNSSPSFNQVIVGEYNPGSGLFGDPILGFPVAGPILPGGGFIGITVPPLNPIIPVFGPTPFSFEPTINPVDISPLTTLSTGIEFTAISLRNGTSLPIAAVRSPVPIDVPVVVPDASSTLFLAGLGFIGLCLFGVVKKQRGAQVEKA